MRFAVVGSGGVGGYFGGRLVQAGHDVTFLARGAHLAAMQSSGLAVESIEGDFTLDRVQATADLTSIGPVDAVLLAVKTWQVSDMAAQLAPLLGDRGKVLTLQNGVEAPDQVARACGRSRVLAGVCRVMSYVVEPGRIRHSAVAPRIEFGDLAGGGSSEAEAVCSGLAGCAGVSARLADDIQFVLWDKFLFIAPFSAVGAATRKPAGVWRDVAESRTLFTAAMTEVVQLAQARGVALPHAAVARTLGFTDQLPADTTSSMQRDLLEGRPSELEAQTGAIVRLAAESGISVPANAFLYAALLPAERQARARAISSVPQNAATRS